MIDKQIRDLIKKEEERQKETLMMIPSENYTYDEVRRSVGSILMHKYSEGYPRRRYYQGNEIIDQVEELCQKRALEAFNLFPDEWGVNVQPHSGCEANLGVYNALLNVGDKIMSMYLPDGGHLSHGWHMGEVKTTLVSKIFKIEFYKVDEKTKVFDFDEIEKQAIKYKPKLIISGGTAYPREMNYKKMSEIAKKVGAYYLADVSHEAGLIAAGVNDSPFKFADVVTMTTHKTLRGPRGALIFFKKEFTNAINFAIMPGLQGGPHNHTIAGIAVALERTKSQEFKNYAKQTVVNAQKLADDLKKGGLDVVSGGTDKHLVLVDLRNKNVSGWFVALALEYAGIVMNRNTVPAETASPFYPSGLRMGTPALTVRGMKEKEMEKIAKWILEVTEIVGVKKLPADKEERLKYLSDFKKEMEKNKKLKEIKKEVKVLCDKFKIPR
jgi:glycine hydroxymethyltransferase